MATYEWDYSIITEWEVISHIVSNDGFLFVGCGEFGRRVRFWDLSRPDLPRDLEQILGYPPLF